ncbi:MAG: FAD-dependent oxidoreductase [Leptonema sp. (in: bacteria)]
MQLAISNWGNFPVVKANYYSIKEVYEFLKQKESSFIVRGLGRSYGDSSLAENIFDGTKWNCFLNFDEKTGILYCEAGVTIQEILEVFVPRGWFVPVTPGTKFVTIGGAISADVHGKNHHKEGSFCKHVVSVEVLLPNGKIIECSPVKNHELFRFICGGMGLLGVILRAKLILKKIESAYILQTLYKAKNLSEMLALFEQHKNSTYTVAWMDCLAKGNQIGRGILFTGEHATKEDLEKFGFKGDPFTIKQKKKFTVPFFLPSFILNPLTVKVFNFLFYHKHKEKTSIVDYDTFFYPLDSIHHWNRIYGRKGFVQYQFVLPKKNGLEGTKEIIHEISKSNKGSFLVVFKLFGDPKSIPQKGSKKVIHFPLSFPEEGYTLALDFSIKGDLSEFLKKLDRIVEKYNGKLYLAKDARMPKEFFYKSYPVKEFLKIKKQYDPKNRLVSLQGERLGLKN